MTDSLTKALLACALILTGAPTAVLRAQGAPTIDRTTFAYDAAAQAAWRLEPAAPGVKAQRFSFDSPRGGAATGYATLPNSGKSDKAVIFFHWGNGLATEWLPEASLYAELGVLCIALDLPWVRPVESRPSVNNFAKPEVDLRTWEQAVIDARIAIDHATKLGARKIGVVGHSYGAQLAALLAGVDDRVNALVLVGGAPTQRAVYLENSSVAIKQLHSRVGVDALKAWTEVVDRYAGAVGVANAKAPVLFQFALLDAYFTESAMNEYAAAAKTAKTVKWYEAGHELNGVDTLIDRGRWLAKQLGFPDPERAVLGIIRE